MYTVLIADDEQNIREGLKYIIDWDSLGFQICGEAANGEDTLQQIRQSCPDLVLLDIRMPKMYGTDIIRLAREQGYHGRFIILSGYSDFTYAQTAIRYDADFYLTKPIDEDELSAAAEKIAADLTDEHNRSQQIAMLKDKARASILYEIITAAPSSRTSPPDPEETAELNLAADIYQVVIYEKYSLRSPDICSSFAELLKITNKGNLSFESFTEDGHETILLKGSFAVNKFRDFLSRLGQHTPQPGSPLDSLFLSYGHPVDSPAEIHLSYREAYTLLKRRFFCRQGQHILGFHELPDQKGSPGPGKDILEQYCRKLTDYLLSFNRGMIAETLSALENELCRTDDISSAKLFLADLYLNIKEKVNITYHTADIPFPSNAAVISRIDGCRYLYEIILYISEMAEAVMAATGNPSRTTVLDDIAYYIDHNFKNNLKLENIAPLFGYNSAYLGKIFNKHFGESFNSYVDHRRIEHSKELLKENNLKVYEIAEAIGYKNVDYFHKKFRKYVGLSPAEYRKKYE